MHPLSIAVAEWGLSFVHLLRRDAGEGRHWAEKEIEISQKYVLPLMLSTGKVQLGWALAEQGHVGEAIEHMLRGAAAMRATGAQMGLPFFLGILAQAHLDNNDCRQGPEVVDEAIVTATESHALFQFPELLRIKGRFNCRALVLRRPKPQCRKSLTAASQQGAKSSELRTSTDLAALWRDRGKRSEARDLLTPIYSWFREGFETRDLVEAKALLDDLVAH